MTETGRELATLGAHHGFDQETIDLIMSTVARECKTKSEKELFLARCSAEGLSPIRQEIYAVRRKTKGGGTVLIFILSYLACIGRAAQAGYEVHLSNAVCYNDDWAGWDAVNSKPLGHIIHGGDRGAVIGAYACWRSREDGSVRGWFWSGKEVFPNESFLKGSLGEHLSMKTAIGRSARFLVPSLMTSLYLAEELGYREIEGSGKLEKVIDDSGFQGFENAKIVTPQEATGQTPGPQTVRPATEPEPVDEPAEPASPEESVAEGALGPQGTLEPAPTADVTAFLSNAGTKIKSGDLLMEWASGVLQREFTTFRDIAADDLATLNEAFEELTV